MSRRYSLVCDDRLARKIDAIAHDYDLTQEEVLRQLVEVGLEEVGTQNGTEISSDS